jgi:hypothetical protein
MSVLENNIIIRRKRVYNMSNIIETSECKKIKIDKKYVREIKCSEINNFHIKTADNCIIKCNRDIIANSSTVFANAINFELGDNYSTNNPTIIYIETPDYNSNIVESIISHSMALANSRVSYRIKKSDTKNTEQLIKFCHQYDFDKLLRILINFICNPKMNHMFGKFSPEELINIGELYNIPKLINYGISIFNPNDFVNFTKFILQNKNNDIKEKLMNRLFTSIQTFKQKFNSEFEKQVDGFGPKFGSFNTPGYKPIDLSLE